MNKEEIENKKRMLKDFSEQGQGQRVFFEEDLELIRDILQELEQKSEILDKVTDKLKEDINRFDKVIKDRGIWGEQKVDFKKYKNYAINLLNIIEGEKK